jgi:hypothetical protein
VDGFLTKSSTLLVMVSCYEFFMKKAGQVVVFRFPQTDLTMGEISPERLTRVRQNIAKWYQTIQDGG